MQTNIPHFDNPITSYEKICNAFTEFVDPKETIEKLLLELSQKDFNAWWEYNNK